VSSTSTRARVATMANLGEFTMDNIDGKATKMSTYKGKVCLVVNVASK
jgi:glutathione peroxidase-family protein